jgi:hypothetical protein
VTDRKHVGCFCGMPDRAAHDLHEGVEVFHVVVPCRFPPMRRISAGSAMPRSFS